MSATKEGRKSHRERCADLFRSVIRSILVTLPRESIWLFMERVVVIPVIAGSRASGPLDTGLMPIWRGALERYERRSIRYVTIAKGARLGGTMLFGTCLVIEKFLRWPGPVGWLDPTGKTAKSVSRREITPFFEACAPLMELAIVGKQTWTVLEKFFTCGVFSMVGSGSINDMGGRQWELVEINEQDEPVAISHHVLLCWRAKLPVYRD
jgi:phage terminase large subunit GpA-like protein